MQKIKVKQIKTFPKNVQAKIARLKKKYRTRTVYFTQEGENFKLYLDEGCSYTLWNANGEEMSFRMVSANTIGATNTGVNYAIGERVPMPAGTWIVEFKLFLGKPFIHVHHVGVAQLQ